MPAADGRAAVAALAEPTVPVRAGYVAAVSLANLGIWAAFFTPIQALLPRQVEEIVGSGHEKAVGLAVVTGVGAFLAIVANPLAGALSDRTVARSGRRRPWLAGGALLGVAGLALLSGQRTVAGVAVAWAVAQTGLNAAYAAITASIPDRVPVRQRATVSGWVGLAQSLGVVVGIAVVAVLVTGLAAGTWAIAALLAVLAVPFLRQPDAALPPSARPPFAWRPFLAAFWVSPRRHPDFAWAWLTRFLVSLGNAMATLYLLYFLKDAVHYPDPDRGQLVLVAVYTAGILVTAVVGGRLSDRSGRRKVYVITSTAVMAVAAVMLAVRETFPAAVAAAAVLGLGYGIYLAVDQALITQVLPAALDRARDLGVINIANSAPQVLAPVIAAPLVTSGWGYPGLYVATAAVTLLGAVLVQPIRSVP